MGSSPQSVWANRQREKMGEVEDQFSRSPQLVGPGDDLYLSLQAVKSLLGLLRQSDDVKRDAK